MKTEEKPKSQHKKNIHDGHRERLLDLIVNAGIDNVSDIQAVEFVLTYVYPRGDVNPLAHRLLDTYGSFTHIVDATPDDLATIPGVNIRAAKKISMISEIFYYYTTSKMGNKFKVATQKDIIDVLEDNLRFRSTEYLVLLAISSSGYITHRKRVKSNKADEVGIPILELTGFLNSSRPAMLAVGHGHPYGKAIPSAEDEKSYKMYKDVCDTCGIELIDSYIIGIDGVYSQKDKKLLRFYYDIDELTNTITGLLE